MLAPPSLRESGRREPSGLGRYLGHERQELSIDVFKERHPFLRPVFVSMDHVWRATEHNSHVMKAFILGVNVGDSEIDHRVVQLGTFLRTVEIEAQTIAIKKRQCLKREEMPEAQHITEPCDCARDVSNLPGNLTNGTKRCACSGGVRGATLVSQGSVRGSSGPVFQSRSIAEGKLSNGVCDMKLDSVQADTESPADLGVGHAVANGISYSPLSGSEDVGMTRAAARHSPGY